MYIHDFKFGIQGLWGVCGLISASKGGRKGDQNDLQMGVKERTTLLLSLWHSRLSHPANLVLSVLKFDLSISKDTSVHGCEVCHRAKSDNGTEFVNKKRHNMFNDLGSYVYTPQQNEIAKRKHRHLLNVARSLMFQGGIPLRLWHDCVQTSVYLINRLPYSVINGKSLFEFEKYVLIGYSTDKKAYKLLSLDSKNVFYSRDVSPNDDGKDTLVVDGNLELSFDTVDSAQEDSLDDVHTPDLRRSSRQSKLPVRFNDYVVNSNVEYGIEKYVNYFRLKGGNLCFATTLNKFVEPTYLKDALSDPNWVEAMNNEIEALNRNNTWTECDLPIRRKPIGKLLHEYGLLAVKPVDIPFPENVVLSYVETDKDKFLSNFTSYQKLVGKLIYLTHTRPDISYVVHYLSQHMHSPLQCHFKAALRVLRYLKGSPSLGLQFNKSSDLKLRAYADAD
ncbi:ribonuclease H-like domain-containing protein [Tanacetum coccineum]